MFFQRNASGSPRMMIRNQKAGRTRRINRAGRVGCTTFWAGSLYSSFSLLFLVSSSPGRFRNIRMVGLYATFCICPFDWIICTLVVMLSAAFCRSLWCTLCLSLGSHPPKLALSPSLAPLNVSMIHWPGSCPSGYHV